MVVKNRRIYTTVCTPMQLHFYSANCLGQRQQSNLSVFESSCHVCPLVNVTRWRLHTVSLSIIAERQEKSCQYQLWISDKVDRLWFGPSGNRTCVSFQLQTLYPLCHWSMIKPRLQNQQWNQESNSQPCCLSWNSICDYCATSYTFFYYIDFEHIFLGLVIEAEWRSGSVLGP